MGNVLIIKDADFSANKVETIPLVDITTYTNTDYLHKNLNLQIESASSTKFKENATYHGGFIDVRNIRGASYVFQNGASATYFAIIKNCTFENNGAFSFCTDTTLEYVSANNSLSGTIPADADYIYIMYYKNAEISTSVTVTVQR